MSAIEALYIFDEHNDLILSHIYFGRPPSPGTLLPLYLQQPPPRSSLIYLPSLSSPTLLYSIIHDNLLFLSPCASDTDPLLVLEFLHRVADALEEFLGSPLLAAKITASYDVVAQIVAEVADAGVVCQGEPNALRDVVETGPGVLKNLLGSIGASGSSPALHSGGPSAVLRPQSQQAQSSQGSAIPWRRSNVRHTNNELYVDLVESLAVIVAPSGRPLSAFAQGSIAFTSKVSGVPDLLLNLSTGGKGAGIGTNAEQLRRVMERVVFHPCVRLNRWRNEGVLSFVPPDGRFALCGYEVDLLGSDGPLSMSKSSISSLNLPAMIEVSTGLGASGSEFEVRLTTNLSSSSGVRSAAAASLQSNLSASRSGGPFRSNAGPDNKSPAFEDLAVHVPISSGVRNITDLRPSRGEAHWNHVDGRVEWKISPKELGLHGAVLRCSVQGPPSDESEDQESIAMNGMTATTYDYDDDTSYQSQQRESATAPLTSRTTMNGSSAAKIERNRELMPTSATLSFSIKGSLASGLKVESLLVDTKRSRGLGPEVKPYKGVKYLTVSREGIEVRS